MLSQDMSRTYFVFFGVFLIEAVAHTSTWARKMPATQETSTFKTTTQLFAQHLFVFDCSEKFDDPPQTTTVFFFVRFHRL